MHSIHHIITIYIYIYKGVGRAGLFACCWLLEHELCFTAMRAVHVVRNQRSPKAIETPRQAEYIINYSIGVSQRHNKLIQKWENVEKYSLRNPRPQPTTSICPTLDLISRMEQNMMMMIQSAYPSDDANHC